MRVFNHEISIRRNETFSIDKIVMNRDGSPYIMSSQLANPHFLVTVSSTLYDTEDRYICNAWLPVNIPRFYSTVPVNVLDFENPIGEKLYESGFDDMTGLPSGYVNGIYTTYTDSRDALFYWENNLGERVYKWYDGNKWVDYICRIVCSFPKSITKDWIEKNYFYNIDLVTGTLKSEYVSGERPFQSIDDTFPILPPTKLSVLSNLKGGM